MRRLFVREKINQRLFGIRQRVRGIRIGGRRGGGSCFGRDHAAFERRAFRYNALLHKPPEGDRQLAGQGNDANLSPPHALVAEPLMPPQRELAVRLVAKPEPSKFDKSIND